LALPPLPLVFFKNYYLPAGPKKSISSFFPERRLCCYIYFHCLPVPTAIISIEPCAVNASFSLSLRTWLSGLGFQDLLVRFCQRTAYLTETQSNSAVERRRSVLPWNVTSDGRTHAHHCCNYI
jgi:hypothetical protein